jgi:integrase
MASIQRRENSKFWQVAFYVTGQDGVTRLVRKSSGTTKRQEALRRALEMERAAAVAAGVDGETAQRIHAIIARAGEDALREKLNLSRARAYISQILKEATGEELSTFTVATWAAEWLKRKEPLVAASTFARYENSQRVFREWLGDRADKPLESLTATTIREFRDSLKPGRTGRTVNAYLKDVRSILGAAVREGLLSTNPGASIEPLPHGDSIAKQPFTPGEVGSLIVAAPSADWKGVILVAAFTGLRLGDCARLRWGAIDLAEQTITVTPTKTRDKCTQVRIPLHPDVLAFFEVHPISDDTEAFAFPSLASRDVKGDKGLSNVFATKIMRDAAVSRGESHNSGSRTTHARSFHSLRHSFTSWLASVGVSPEIRQAMTGHLDGESHKLYTHHDPASLRSAIDKMPGLTE